MRAAALLPLILCACVAPGRPQAGAGAAAVGLPKRTVSTATIEANAAAQAPDARREPSMPEIMPLPAQYRLLVVDGHLALVREDASEPAPAMASVRIGYGAQALPDPTYHPEPLPQEVAAELQACRQSSSRMEGALQTVMQRSRELAERALEIEAQGKRLAELLAASEARVRQLEAAGSRPPAAPDQAAQPQGPGP